VGAGVLCVGHPFVRFRFQAGTTNTAGYIEKELDLAHLPTFPGSSVLPGETWYFQAWFRDGQTSNFTDALEVPFI
jgi:hypothetical protein